MNKKLLIVCIILVFTFLSLRCAPGDDRWDKNINPDNKAGFFAGIWHGLIIVVTFIVSLFNSRVGIYETYNTGWPYNLGFLIGLCFSFFAPWRAKWFASRKKSRCNKDE